MKKKFILTAVAAVTLLSSNTAMAATNEGILNFDFTGKDITIVADKMSTQLKNMAEIKKIRVLMKFLLLGIPQ